MQNVSRRRDRHDIVAEILQNAKGGTKMTHLMYKARLSYGQVTEYIPALIEKGYLERLTIKGRHKTEQHLLKTTDVGVKFLDNLRATELALQRV